MVVMMMVAMEKLTTHIMQMTEMFNASADSMVSANPIE
jgi:hypothetical protein